MQEENNLPPPKPLIAKSMHESAPAIHVGTYAFEQLPDFPGSESIIDSRSEITEDLQDPEWVFSSLFSARKLVYVRSPPFTREGFPTFTTKNVSSKVSSKKKCLQGQIGSNSSLSFESRFESGNLWAAAQESDNVYNLLMQTDINSKGHTQWFFFKVTNTLAQKQVKFRILNFVKTASLHSQGMKIAIFSTLLSESKGTGWSRGGDFIKYEANGLLRHSGGTFYTLSFHYTFPYSNDTVYFAYAVPYTYTQLQLLLDSLSNDPIKSNFISRKTLCKTLAGNNCDYLTITHPGTIEQNRAKKAVVISARAHPGETVGSWMMQGVLEYLSSPEAQILREKYVFKVVPMINPDGVINGNYRCSLTGKDLNRCWKYPQKSRHPTVRALKSLVQDMAGANTFDLIIDLHGHSRKKDIFAYGCSVPGAPEATRLFPYVLSSYSELFDYKSCRFGIHPSKESTLRVALFRELGITNVFTLEASFQGPRSGGHFTTSDLQTMGRDLCRSLLVYTNAGEFPLLNSSVPRLDTFKQQLLSSEEDLYVGEGDSSGSDSNPSEDNLDQSELDELVPGTPPPSLERTEIRAKLNKRNTDSKRVKKNTQLSLKNKTLPPKPKSYSTNTGKMVRDQQTQTPTEFYPKIAKIRAELARSVRLNNITRSVASLPPKNYSNNRPSNNELRKFNKHPFFVSTIRARFQREIAKNKSSSETRMPELFPPSKTFEMPKGSITQRLKPGFYAGFNNFRNHARSNFRHSYH